MDLVFPKETITIRTDEGLVLMRICDICGAAVVEAEDTDYAYHREWHDKTGSRNWLPSRR